MNPIDHFFPAFSLIPVVVIDDVQHAVPLAKALLAGGITSIEITLRTPAALQAIEAVAKAVPDIIVGAGTITSPEQMRDAVNAGAQFHISPGVNHRLAAYAQEQKIAWIGGIATASDILLSLEYGFSHMKFFPAEASGGAAMLKQLAAVFGDCRFCPTGGITMANMKDYQAQPYCFAVGGSWLSPKDAIANQDWSRITQIARDSVAALA